MCGLCRQQWKYWICQPCKECRAGRSYSYHTERETVGMIGKTKFKYSILTAVGGLSLLGSVVGAGADDGNLLANSEFLDGVQHWTAADGPVQYGATEIQSMYLMNTASADAGLPAVVYQCVDVSEGDQYHFRANVQIDAGQPKTGAAWLAMYWWDDEGCGGSLLDMALSERVTHSAARAYDTVAPEGARSAWAAVANSHDPAAPKAGDRLFATLWDDLYFGVVGTAEAPAEAAGDTAEGQDGAVDETAEDEDDSGKGVGRAMLLAAGVIGAAAVVVGGSAVLPRRRKR